MIENDPVPDYLIQRQYQEWERQNDIVLDHLIQETWLKYHRACPKDVRMTAEQQLAACSNCPELRSCRLGQRILETNGYPDLGIGVIMEEDE